MISQAAFFVQFPHPHGEHQPRGSVMPWNTGEHGRKFLISSGRYLDFGDSVTHGDLVFWGEWEPPSTVVARWPAAGHLPRVLHRPYWYSPDSDGYRQNTDPWVFGDQMLYSNCKQTTSKGTIATSMQKLTRGSVVCFGSTLGGEFCADTVLVIASAQPWNPAHPENLGAGPAFQVCTAGSLGCGGGAPARLTLYRGATIDDPVDGMYSFVPALPAGPPVPRFARPPIRLPGLINPASKQAANGAARSRPAQQVRDAWEAIRHQGLTAGLVLAVSLETPPKTNEGPPVLAGSRTRC